MKGSYHIIVQNSRVFFEFDIKRNITVIRGDSATGKTTLISLIDEFSRLGEDSGVNISCEARCISANNANWEGIIENTVGGIIFFDEDASVVKSQMFASKIRGTENYYVIVTREKLSNLPYSVDEIYGIHSSGKYSDLRKTYNSFFRLYDVDSIYHNDEPAKRLIVEDSNAGYEFFKAIVPESVTCVSAGGKTGIQKLLNDSDRSETLIVADGAAFGSEMNELYLYMKKHPEIKLYLPESFEWIILSSGLVDGKRVSDILSKPEDVIDSNEYFSWEQFFTHLLVEETKDTYLHYSKSKLNKAYLNARERKAVVDVTEIIKPILGICL